MIQDYPLQVFVL